MTQCRLGQKAMMCLLMAGTLHDNTSKDAGSKGYAALHARAVDLYSQKAVQKMFDSLNARGYIESGVSSETGWLTKKGWDALSTLLPTAGLVNINSRKYYQTNDDK